MSAGSLAGLLVRRVLIGLALLLVATCAVLYFSARSRLEASLDEELDHRAAALCSVLHIEGTELEFEFDPLLMPEYSDHAPLWYFEVRDANGVCVERSNSLHEAELGFVTKTEQRVFGDIRTRDGRRGRACAVSHVPIREHAESIDYSQLSPPVPTPLTIVVASGRELVEGPLRSFAVAMGLAFAFFAIGSVAIVNRSVRAGLAPLGNLTRELEGIGPATLERRVAHDALPVELEPLARYTNAMLERIHEGMDRERVFTTSIAHELRTPIAELRTGSEVALRGTATPDELALCVRSNLDVAKEMEDIVEALLFLRRADLGRAELTVEEVDLARLVHDALDASAALRAKRRIEIVSNIPSAIHVRTHAVLLSLVLRNLLANACEYAPEGGTVRVDVQPSNAGITLSVSNPTAELTAQDVKNLGTPFWRKDRSRAERVHAGLGISVVMAACRGLRIVVSFELADGMLHARLRMPS